MNDKKTFKRVGFVAISNIIKLISSILVGLVIPKILGVTNYGYYKVFLLYLTYIGFFHFGFIDGIYLKYGGIDYDDLNKIKFRTYFKFLLNLELVVSLIGIVFTLLFVTGEKKFIFIMLFVNLLALNLTTFYQFVSQITSRFKEYSARMIILSISNTIIVIYLYFSNISDYKLYISLIVFVNFLLLLWYIYTYKDITFGKKNKINSIKEEISLFFKNGIPLLFANLATTLVITVDKQIVEIFFSIEIFGVYSFAYSMLAMITVIITAISIVLYPSLKKLSIKELYSSYSRLNKIIIFVVIIGLFGYFPLLWLIPRLLPDYTGSLPIFRVALPGLLFASSISAIKHNFFKVLNKNLYFLYISLFIILLNIILNLIAYYIYESTIVITATSIIGFAVWYCITEIYIVKQYHVKWKLNTIYILLALIIFYLITGINNYILSGLLYLVFVIILVLFAFKKDFSQYLSKRRKNNI